jgi:hypothetical protein
MKEKYCVCNNGYICNNCFLEEIRKQANKQKEDARNINAIEDLFIELGCGCDGHEDECDLLSPNCSVMKAEVCYNNLLLSYRNLKDEFINQLKQIILDQSTVHATCDARYIARCNPQEEQEIGREQVLDEIRAFIEKWS